MELRYNTTAQDYIALFNQYASDSVVAERFVRMTFFVIPALAWFSTFLFYTKQHTANYNYIFSGAFALLLTVSLPKLYDAYQNAFWRSVVTESALQGLVGPTVVTVTNEQIQEVTSNVMFHATWNEVERIEQTKEHLFIYLSPLLAIVVPQRAFADESAYRSFKEQIQNHHSTGRLDPNSTKD